MQVCILFLSIILSISTYIIHILLLGIYYQVCSALDNCEGTLEEALPDLEPKVEFQGSNVRYSIHVIPFTLFRSRYCSEHSVT